MTELFDRRATITVGTLQIAASQKPGLRCTFEIEKTLNPKPNKATVSIYNLTESHRAEIEAFDSVPVQIEAGYKDTTSVLFLGDLRTAGSFRSSHDIVTTIASGDGEKALKTARINASYQKTKPTDALLRDLAKALGVKPGNLDKAVLRFRQTLNTSPFSKGTVLSGSAASEMTRVCRSLNLEWSVQDGALQILEYGQTAAGTTAVMCSARTGMIGSPTVDGKGVLSVRMFLNKETFPGRLLVLDAERLKGQFRITDTRHAGDTHGNEWCVDIKAKRY